MTEIVWKKIYHTVSRRSNHASPEVVTEVLAMCKEALLAGLNYKSYARDDFVTWSLEVNISNSMKEFVHEICQDFGLEGKLMYSTLCNYLMFEYHGKIREFWQLTALGTTAKLKELIWMFFVSERMFYLQTVRYIFESVNEHKHPLSTTFRTFLNTIDVNVLQDSLIGQFEELPIEIAPPYFCESPSRQRQWLVRNTREQIALVCNIILSTYELKLSAEQFTRVLKFLCDHMFNTKAVSYEHPDERTDVRELFYAEIALFFTVIENLWGDNMSEFFRTENGHEVKASMCSLMTNQELAAVALAWILLKHDVGASEVEDDKVEELTDKQPFVLLHQVVSHPMFANSVLGTYVLNSVHRFVDKLCLSFVDRTALYEKPDLVLVVSDFIKIPSLTEICLQQRNGADFIVELSYKTFPYDFFSLTTLARAILKRSKFTEFIVSLLRRVPYFLSELTWSVPATEVCILRAPQRAITNSDLIIFNPDTRVSSFRIFGQNLLQYQGEYSYFVYLEYLVNQMLEIARLRHVFDEELAGKVAAGYELVIDLLEMCPGRSFEELGVKKVLDQLERIIQYNEDSMTYFNLVRIYLRVYLVRIKYHECVFARAIGDQVFSTFLPKLKSAYLTADVKSMLYDDFIFENTTLNRIFQQEEMGSTHGLLLAYLELLLTQIEAVENTTFQLAGVAFLLNYALLQHQNWTYNDDNERTQITITVMRILHTILKKDKNAMTPSEERLYNLVHHSLLYNANVVEAFLRLFVKEKHFVVMSMECETNWNNRDNLPLFQALRWQLALLLLVMQRRKEDNLTDTELYNKLELVVKSIVSFFVNDHSSLVSQLSCRFLEKLAEDENTRLLALLEFDHYQVQALFLERLRDPLEEEDLKLAIVDLITTCVSKQNGMMAAFLNLKCFLYWDGTPVESYSGDTVSDFMVDYLQNIRKSKEYLKNPLQLGILKLLHKLWLNYRSHLLRNVTDLDEFWPTMIEPLKNDFVYDHEVYTLILKILNLELTANADDVDQNLAKEVAILVSHDVNFGLLVDFMLHCTAQKDVELVGAFMEFIILAIKIANDKFTAKNKLVVTLGCLDAMEVALMAFTQQEFLYIWSQLYLMVVQTWSLYAGREEVVVNKLSTLFNACNAHYTHLTARVKATVFGIIHQILVKLQSHFSAHEDSLIELLKPVGNMIDNEYQVFESEDWISGDDAHKSELAQSWMIGVMIFNVLLEYENVKQLEVWFWYRQLGTKVLSVIPVILEKMALLGLARLAIDFLNSYAASPLNADVVKMDLMGFYYKIRPPDITVKPMDFVVNGLPVAKKEWWHVYLCLTRFNHTMLTTLKGTAVPLCITYLTQCDRAIYDCLQLPKDTVDLTALDLVREIVQFIYTLQDMKPDWCLEVPQTYAMMMEGMKVALNACTLTLLATKKVTFYEVQSNLSLNIVESPPTEVIVEPLTKMVEIVFWILNTLRRAKPDLAEMMQGRIPPEVEIHLVNDFNVPKYDYAISPTLTYGTVLCLAHYLCKAININPHTARAEYRRVLLTGLPEKLQLKSLDRLVQYVTGTYDKHIGFIIRLEDIPTESLPTFLYYELADVVTSSTVIEHFDQQIVTNALEVLMTFLTAEILCTSKNLEPELLPAYKRELASELQFFYEFVRKRSSEVQAKAGSPVSTSRVTAGASLHVNDKEIIQKYIQMKKLETEGELSEHDFVLVIAQWLIGFCESSC